MDGRFPENMSALLANFSEFPRAKKTAQTSHCIVIAEVRVSGKAMSQTRSSNQFFDPHMSSANS